jgi:succinyl-diaminopimelate desuccinylase
MSATLELAEALIRRRSVTPEDDGCQDLIAERLSAAGFSIDHLDFAEVHNLWARRGDRAPLLVFAGHTDVVPPGSRHDWRFDPFEPTIHEGLLYGRGAADMKGSIAAMITACERFLNDHGEHKGSIGFLITSDEEGPAVDGTVKVVEHISAEAEHIDWALVGEPTSSAEVGDVIKNGRRGSLNGRLRVLGIQGHVAYPQLADNPVHRFAPALTELVERHWDSGNRHFPPTTFQISNLQAGTGARNVIPGELIVEFNFRFCTESSAEGLQAAVTEILDRHRLDYRLDWSLSGDPFLTREGELVDATRAAVREITGYQPELSTAGGTSDGRFIAPTGAQVVELGPVNASIHKVNEHVRVDDLNTLSAIYQRILERLLL